MLYSSAATYFIPSDLHIVLFRSGFYKWNGLLGKYFASITEASRRTIASFITSNSAVYPNSPTSYTCQPTIYKTKTYEDDYFALLFLGYLRLPKNANYQLELYINAYGEIVITKSSTEEITGTSDRYVSILFLLTLVDNFATLRI